MVTIIGYGYDAALHCPDCTRADHAHGMITSAPAEPRDQHSLPEAMTDRHGNDVHPLFSTDECGDSGDHCDRCFADLRA